MTGDWEGHVYERWQVVRYRVASKYSEWQTKVEEGPSMIDEKVRRPRYEKS